MNHEGYKVTSKAYELHLFQFKKKEQLKESGELRGVRCYDSLCDIWF